MSWRPLLHRSDAGANRHHLTGISFHASVAPSPLAAAPLLLFCCLAVLPRKPAHRAPRHQAWECGCGRGVGVLLAAIRSLLQVGAVFRRAGRGCAGAEHHPTSLHPFPVAPHPPTHPPPGAAQHQVPDPHTEAVRLGVQQVHAVGVHAQDARRHRGVHLARGEAAGGRVGGWGGWRTDGAVRTAASGTVCITPAGSRGWAQWASARHPRCPLMARCRGDAALVPRRPHLQYSRCPCPTSPSLLPPNPTPLVVASLPGGAVPR